MRRVTAEARTTAPTAAIERPRRQLRAGGSVDAVREFRWPVRVYWEDTDAGGVVYHARYLHFLERARTEWLRSVGLGQQALRDQHGVVFVVHRMEIAFDAPARLDDELTVTLRLAVLRSASLVVEQALLRGAESPPLLQATVRIACVDAAKFRPSVIPRALATLIAGPP